MSPPEKTSLIAEIPCQRGDKLWSLEDDKLIQLICSRLIQIGWVKEKEVIGASLNRIDYGYPVSETGFEEKAYKINNFLKTFNNLKFSDRNGKFMYAWIHDMMKFLAGIKINLKLFIFLPVFAYIISYLYLAYYHGKFLILNTIVHESGKYTLLQDIFFASHFLGHIPIHTVLAFLFIGSYLCLTELNFNTYNEKKIQKLFILLVFFLVSSFFLSLIVFGREDTFAFITQQRQRTGDYTEGGSWNLHLPSTILLFFLIPVYIYIVKMIFGRGIKPNLNGLFYISLGFTLFFFFTFLFNSNAINTFFSICKDPRYLGHSVRELLTFPITYFPIPLYFILRREKRAGNNRKKKQSKNLKHLILCLTIICLIGVLYQSYISLTKGIGNIAQKPDFAKCGELGIPYLLASHYFEHFLDTIYFTLLCLLLYGIATNKTNEINRTSGLYW